MHNCELNSFTKEVTYELHGSKVSRESDLCSVPYSRPVGVRSLEKNVKSLSENQHNS